MSDMTEKFKTALETAAVVGTAGAVGAYAAFMLQDQVAAVKVVPAFIWTGLGAGVLGGAARSIQEGLTAGTYTFSVNANTGVAVGALAAFMAYTNVALPVGFGVAVGSPMLHGFIAGALGGWFV